MLNIYVATASSPLELAEEKIRAVKASGHHITYDWTIDVRRAGVGSPDDSDVRRRAALADLKGVMSANVLWLVQPDPTSSSTGAWVELGVALSKRELARDIVIVASGSSKKCIFTDLADYRFQSHDDAFEFITKDLGFRKIVSV